VCVYIFIHIYVCVRACACRKHPVDDPQKIETRPDSWWVVCNSELCNACAFAAVIY
jgi:hypothetical protein